MASKQYHQASTAAEEEIISKENQPTVLDEYEDSDEETNDENGITAVKRAKSSALSNLEHKEGSTPQQQQQKSQRCLKPKRER